MSRSHTKDLVAKSLDMSAVEIIRARRAYTVPQQLLKSHELPSLPKTHAVPKRYEETKPVKIQNFTHQRIMDLGELINRQERDDNSKAHHLAVEKAIADTWEAADQIKMQAVKDSLAKAQIQHEKQLRRLSKQHERALKEEALTVETMMQNKMRELLETERIQAANDLQVAVEQVRYECLIELQEAVDATRKEEQEIAYLERQQILHEAAQTLQATKDELAEEQRIALKELDEKKENERHQAVKEAKALEQEIRANAVITLQQQHALDIRKLGQTIVNVECQVNERDKQLAEVQSKREQLYDELVKVQADYQDFIDKHPSFDPGQTGYLLRDLQSNPNVVDPYTDTEKGTRRRKSNPRRS